MNYAYTTLLSSDDYLYGALGLYYSLQLSQTKYDFIMVVTDNVSLNTLEKLDSLNIKYRVFPDLRNYYFNVLVDEHRLSLNTSEFFQINVMNRFYMFDLKEYDKLCYFDADILVRKNIDFIFNYNAPAAKFLTFGDVDNKNYNDIERPFKDGVQLAAENMLINPQDFSSKDIIDKIKISGFDEYVLPTMYDITQITNLTITDNMEYVIHAHSHGNGFKYWEHFHFNTTEDVVNFCAKIKDISFTNDFMDIKMKYGDYNCSNQFTDDLTLVDLAVDYKINEDNLEKVKILREERQNYILAKQKEASTT